MPLDKIRLYDESATAYHRRYRLIQRVKYQVLVPYLREGPLVDVGVGTGIGLPTLTRFRPIVGIDGSIEMLRIAQNSVAAGKTGSTDVSLICSEATSLPLRTGCFSTVLSVTVLQNLSDVRQGVRELVRAARPGGLLGITVLEKSLSLEQIEAYTAGSAKLVERLTDLAHEDSGLILRRSAGVPQT